jgi:hypothetical protein
MIQAHREEEAAVEELEERPGQQRVAQVVREVGQGVLQGLEVGREEPGVLLEGQAALVGWQGLAQPAETLAVDPRLLSPCKLKNDSEFT